MYGQGMDEILKNEAKIREVLRQRNGRMMTPEEYRDQCQSYIVGNAFDVFSDTEIVNRHLLQDIDQRRLKVAG
jgi:hypothetical protein